MKATLPDNEAERRAAIRQYQIIDTDPEPAFDDLASLAAHICGTPIALINLIDGNRQWFKSKLGLDVTEMPRDFGLCPQCIQQRDILVIPDTLADDRFATNPVVTTPPHIRFYAGVPLITPAGQIIGTLCVADTVPHQLSLAQVEALQALSRQIISQLELRRHIADMARIATECQQAEAEMRNITAENLKLARVVAAVSDGVIVTDPNQPDNPIIYANPAFSRITGYLPEEIIGRNCRFLQGVGTDRKVVSRIKRAVAKRQELQATLLNYRKDGQPFWNEVKISPVFSEKGDLLYFVGIQTDITARKIAEEQMRSTQIFLNSIVENIPHAIFVKDAKKLKYVSINKAGAEMIGFDKEEIIGQSDYDFLTPELADLFTAKDREVLSNKKVVDIPEEPIPTKKKEIKFLHTKKIPILEKAGKPQYLLGIAEDITDRKSAQEQIREQATLLDKSQDAILVLDTQDCIRFCNESAQGLYGCKKSEIVGCSSEVLFKHSPEIQQARQTVFATGEWHGELRQVTKNGKEIVVESRWTLVRDEEDKPKSILIVNTDITEKKQLEVQFQRAQRLESLGTLAGGMAHDLNNILTPILTSVQILEMVVTDERSQRLLNLLENNVKRGANLIKQVLSFARGTEGEREVIQIFDLIEEVAKIVKETFPKSIDLFAPRPITELWPICGDATQLHQVLINLCVNARDAMPNGGTLNISAENITIDSHYTKMNIDAKVGRYVVIDVADTGCGIPPEIIDRIFEPFFTTKEIGKGSGLGLSTVMGIIKGHGGFINAYSEVGKGTRFKIYLPALENREIKSSNSAGKILEGNGELILVVDDEVAICDVTKASLEAYNYTAITANDGLDAIALYADQKDDISAAIVDMMMPSMDGLTTIRTLQKINPQVKVIASSGLLSNVMSTELANIGVSNFLSKPYTAEQLLKTLHQVIANG
ncbi:hybrid sensor histidine kinase/response regulator [Microseira wollei]|uniref:histidine kinase n=1 Tax=Microseira wollei NIES-4236 TaxID=2530354 RepID=A0AAV3X8R4_9CYAN|nr:PAS domain S-box protein [Microseira wollei]GET37080.1 two-component hybrid sensor and regulator [Microseira wollei NIES-4236]